MPDKNPPRRTIKGTPARTGSYAAGTTAQLQGKASNKTQQYLDALDAADPGRQAFYQAALSDIPHPLQPGQQMSYGQLQELLRTSQAPQALESYAASRRLPKAPTAGEYQQAMFDEANARLLERAAAAPGEYAFPPAADAARRAPNIAAGIAHGNYASPDQAEQVVNAAMLQQRFADLPVGEGAYVAPGMAQQAPPPPPAVVARRVIRGSVPGAVAAR